MRKLLLLALLACAAAHAAKVRVTWTNPSSNTNGTALTNLASITVVWGSCTDAGTMGTIQASVTIPTTVDGAQMSAFAFPVGLSPVCLAAYASNTNGVNSALSTVASWTPPSKLGQPTAIAGVIHLHFRSSHAKS